MAFRRSARGNPIKTPQDFVTLAGRHAGTIIDDGRHGSAIHARQFQADIRSLWSVADRILHQIARHLRQQFLVALNVDAFLEVARQLMAAVLGDREV